MQGANRYGRQSPSKSAILPVCLSASSMVDAVTSRCWGLIVEMRIAVVGAGISGLVVAHLLHRAHDITVFEANAYPGGHTNTIRVDTPYETHHVDTGFIVFNDLNYQNFERLLERLAVGWQRSTMSFSVSDGIGDFGTVGRLRMACSPSARMF